MKEKKVKAYVLKSNQRKEITNYFTCQSDSDHFVTGIPHVEVFYCTQNISTFNENKGRISRLCKKARHRKISEEDLAEKLKSIMGDKK